VPRIKKACGGRIDNKRILIHTSAHGLSVDDSTLPRSGAGFDSRWAHTHFYWRPAKILHKQIFLSHLNPYPTMRIITRRKLRHLKSVHTESQRVGERAIAHSVGLSPAERAIAQAAIQNRVNRLHAQRLQLTARLRASSGAARLIANPRATIRLAGQKIRNGVAPTAKPVQTRRPLIQLRRRRAIA